MAKTNTPRVNLLRSHGTWYQYRTVRCRCVFCKGAAAQYRREYAQRHPAKTANVLVRTCRHCGITKQPGEFYASSGNTCKSCIDIRTKARRLAAAPGRERAMAHERYVKRRDDIGERHRIYREEHKQEMNIYSLRYARRHPERIAATKRNRTAQKRQSEGAHTGGDIEAQYGRQRGRCFWCGNKVGRSYHVDHVVPLALGGSNGPENLVVSCPHCNQSKSCRHPMDFAGVML